MTLAANGFNIGEWRWYTRHASPCRVVDRQDVWGETSYRVWLPIKDAVARALARLDPARQHSANGRNVKTCSSRTDHVGGSGSSCIELGMDQDRRMNQDTSFENGSRTPEVAPSSNTFGDAQSMSDGAHHKMTKNASVYKIEMLIRNRGHVSFQALLDELEVSPATLKRDKIIGSAKRPVSSQFFELIGEAMLKRKRLHMRYLTRGRGEVGERDVSHQRLVHYRNTWYVDAWCHTREKLLRFALDAIESAETLETRAKDVPRVTSQPKSPPISAEARLRRDRTQEPKQRGFGQRHSTAAAFQDRQQRRR